mgnify:CR=1 FL=1
MGEGDENQGGRGGDGGKGDAGARLRGEGGLHIHSQQGRLFPPHPAPSHKWESALAWQLQTPKLSYTHLLPVPYTTHSSSFSLFALTHPTHHHTHPPTPPPTHPPPAPPLARRSWPSGVRTCSSSSASAASAPTPPDSCGATTTAAWAARWGTTTSRSYEVGERRGRGRWGVVDTSPN